VSALHGASVHSIGGDPGEVDRGDHEPADDARNVVEAPMHFEKQEAKQHGQGSQGRSGTREDQPAELASSLVEDCSDARGVQNHRQADPQHIVNYDASEKGAGFLVVGKDGPRPTEHPSSLGV
jgi:hypothetical protein